MVNNIFTWKLLERNEVVEFRCSNFIFFFKSNPYTFTLLDLLIILQLFTTKPYACNEGQQKDDPSIKYGIDSATWVEFAKSRQTPNWQVWFKYDFLIT